MWRSQFELSPSDGESPPGGFVEESVQGGVLQYPEATQPPESSVEPLGTAGGDGQPSGTSEPAATGQESSDALSAPGQASSESPVLQGHVQESVELSPSDGESRLVASSRSPCRGWCFRIRARRSRRRARLSR